MYAIPAETASQGQPFQKENLPGPGKPYFCCDITLSLVTVTDTQMQKLFKRKLGSEMASNFSFAKKMGVLQHIYGLYPPASGTW